jgi:uncharacterized repeat protein (TIGR02543 family)
VWRLLESEQLVDEQVVHFNPKGGSWTGPNATYYDVMSEDGIIKNMPPNPNIAPGPAPGGNSTRIFAGWVTTETYGTVTGGVGNNIIVISGNTNAGSIDFFVWSQVVSDLVQILQPHSGEKEHTVYALWLDVPKNTALINFYDNIPQISPPAPIGRLLFEVYLGNDGTPAYVPLPPKRQGYVFRGWDTNANGTGTRYYDTYGTNAPFTNVKFTNGQNLYAIWAPADYALQFLPNTIDYSGDQLVGNPSGAFNAMLCPSVNNTLKYPLSFPSPPSLSGYDFLGWNTDPAGFGYFVSPAGVGDIISAGGDLRFSLLENAPPNLIPGSQVAGYTRLYAQWDRIPIASVQVTFDAMGGRFDDEIADGSTQWDEWTTEDGKLNVSGYSAPKWLDENDKNLFIFKGWSRSDSPDREVDFLHPYTEVFFESITVYAVWEPAVPAHTVTFWPNNGEWPGPDGANPVVVETDDYGLVVYVPYSYKPVGPERTGFRFVGWNTEVDGTGTLFLSDFEVSTNMNVYAQWASDTPGNVVIYFLFNDGTSNMYLDDVVSGTSIVAPTLPQSILDDPNWHFSNEGWTFDGWYKESTCVNAWNFAIDIAENDPTLLYAKWLVDITFELNYGSSLPAYSVAPTQYGCPVAEPS